MKNSIKRILILYLVINTACLLYACGITNNAKKNSECNQKKVAVLFSSYAEIWNIANEGIEDPVPISISVGEAVERGFADKNVILVDSGAGHSSINVEKLISENPHLVIATEDFECQRQAAEICRKNGIDARTYHIETFEEYLGVLKELCDITGNEAAYKKYGKDVSDEISLITASAKLSDKKVLLLRSGTTARSIKAKNAENSFIGKMLNDIGIKNIADDVPYLMDGLSIEKIIEESPDVILISTMGDEQASKDCIDHLFKENGWKDLAAVTQKNYYFLDKDLFHFKPNQRWAEAYKKLIDLLY